jgi:hypothetical protein
LLVCVLYTTQQKRRSCNMILCMEDTSDLQAEFSEDYGCTAVRGSDLGKRGPQMVIEVVFEGTPMARKRHLSCSRCFLNLRYVTRPPRTSILCVALAKFIFKPISAGLFELFMIHIRGHLYICTSTYQQTHSL